MTEKKSAAIKFDKEGNLLSGGILLPNGSLYIPKSDDLILEAKTAAREAGLSKFKLFINGTQIINAAKLPSKTISGLTEVARIAGIDEPTVAVKRYDKAG